MLPLGDKLLPDVVINTEHMSPHPSRIIGDTPPELATRTTKLDWWLGGLRQQQAAHFAFGLAPIRVQAGALAARQYMGGCSPMGGTRLHGAYSARGLAVPQPRWSCSQRAPPAGKAHGDGVKPCVCHAHWRSSCNIRAISDRGRFLPWSASSRSPSPGSQTTRRRQARRPSAAPAPPGTVAP